MSLKSILKDYLTRIREQRAQPNSSAELSYRDHLSWLFAEVAKELKHDSTRFTNEAKTGAEVPGRPDYAVTDGLNEIGYVEAESLTTDLDHMAGATLEQNKRLKENLHNFLLTNHFDFQLFVDGKKVLSARLPEPPEQGKITVSDAVVEDFQRLLDRFLDAAAPPATSAEAIAKAMARRARLLRFAAEELLSHENGPLHGYWEAYKETLYPDMEAKEFADVYAQTFTYGLFMTWLNNESLIPFDRENAMAHLPKAIPPIRTLLRFGGGEDLPDELVWIVDGICADLAGANPGAVFKTMADGRNPMVHWYETFLAAFDPQKRERVGVYYTPDAVVDFIVRAVDDLLVTRFDKPTGLADPSVVLLDPAVGTGTFLDHAYRKVHATMLARNEFGQWKGRAKDHLSANFHGFEILPAAYTLAHIKLRHTLDDLGADIGETDRLPVYLTNSLEESVPQQTNMPFTGVLAKEANLAAEVKKSKPVLVVIGNPPYSGHSANPSKHADGSLTHIGKLMQEYFQVDGHSLNERNPKWLQDDYVKFIRFAQDRIERTGHGVVGFVTNHGYLDNPTFRGMRQSLLRTFDEIYVYDLHGNTKKKETAPDASKDENVFDIQQGVAICLLVKRTKSPEDAVVRHADLYGPRSEKYDTLHASTLESVPWTELTPVSDSYLFVPQDRTLFEEYERGWKVTDIFPINGVGMTTARDGYVIDYDASEVIKRARAFRDAEGSDADICKRLGIPLKMGWNVASARRMIQSETDLASFVKPILYRPFDQRVIFYHDSLVWRTVKHVMRHMLAGKNIALSTTRSTEVGDVFSHVFASRQLLNHHTVSLKEVNYVFPLFTFPSETGLSFTKVRQPNLAPAFVAAVKERIGCEPTPEDIFHYIYGVLHAPTYRSRYAEFLKRDFPRIPLPPDDAAFRACAEVGEKLVALHLLEAPSLNDPGIGYPIAGDHQVKKMRAVDRYNAQTQRIMLNEKQYFENVTPETWDFRVGGYQPAYKWLDDRNGRFLTDADITHYRKALAAMRDTVGLLPEADAAFGRLGIT